MSPGTDELSTSKRASCRAWFDSRKRPMTENATQIAAKTAKIA
jgi:hypothetical protein